MTKHHGYRSVITTSTGEIGQVRNISGPGTEFADIDTTCMDSSSNYRTFVAGLGDPGEVTISLVYDPTMSSHLKLADAANNLETRSFTVYQGSTSGDSDAFEAHVKGISREIPYDDLITADLTLKVTGIPGWTT